MTRSRHEGPSLGKPCAYSMVRRRTTYVKYLVYLTACEVGRLGVGKRILDRTRWGGRLPRRQAQPQTESNKHRARHAIDRSLCRSASDRWRDGHGACWIRSEAGLVDEVAGHPTASDQGSAYRRPDVPPRMLLSTPST